MRSGWARGEREGEEGATMTRDDGIDVAVRYVREIAELADRMEADGDGLRNRGKWNQAVWLLRSDVRDKLAAFIGERVLATGEAAESEATR